MTARQQRRAERGIVIRRGRLVHAVHASGKTALVRRNTKNAAQVLAQFDDQNAIREGVPLAHGWHTFRRAEFKVTA